MQYIQIKRDILVFSEFLVRTSLGHETAVLVQQQDNSDVDMEIALLLSRWYGNDSTSPCRLILYFRSSMLDMIFFFLKIISVISSISLVPIYIYYCFTSYHNLYIIITKVTLVLHMN